MQTVNHGALHQKLMIHCMVTNIIILKKQSDGSNGSRPQSDEKRNYLNCLKFSARHSKTMTTHCWPLPAVNTEHRRILGPWRLLLPHSPLCHPLLYAWCLWRSLTLGFHRAAQMSDTCHLLLCAGTLQTELGLMLHILPGLLFWSACWDSHSPLPNLWVELSGQWFPWS